MDHNGRRRRGRGHRLRLRVPVGAGDTAVAGAAFGSERRDPYDPVPRQSGERPAPTAPAHRYVAAASGPRGLALLAPGFFEYEWSPHREFLVTLVRSVGELSRPDLPSRPGHAAWPAATPDAQERGRHVVDLAVIPVTDADGGNPDALEQCWEDAFAPLQSVFIREFTGEFDPAEWPGVTLDGEALVFSAAKPAESGEAIVLRCYNVADAPAEGRWTLPSAAGAAWLALADESIVEPLTVIERQVAFTAAPRGIVTVIVTPAVAGAESGAQHAIDC